MKTKSPKSQNNVVLKVQLTVGLQDYSWRLSVRKLWITLAIFAVKLAIHHFDLK